MDREVSTKRKPKHKSEKGSSPGAKPGTDTDVQEEEGNLEGKKQNVGMTRLEWLELSSKTMHHGYNPEQDTFELLQGDGNPFPHPMQLPTRSADLNSLHTMLKNLRCRPGKRLFRPLTAKHVNIHDLIRKLDKRSDKPSIRLSVFTFYPGNSDALHPKLPKAKEFFFLNQLTTECFFTWFFAPCSQTVKGFVRSMAKIPQLEARIGQLLGFVTEFDEFVGGKLLQIISVYAWLHILFEDLWALLQSTMDPAAHIAPSAKVQWRSRFAERELSALEATTIAVYIIERIIYTNPDTNVEEKFRYELDTVENLCHNIESGVLGAFPQQLAVARCEDAMEIRIKHKFRLMVMQTKDEDQFSPYRYFLGKQPAGTGETYISIYIMYMQIYLYIFIYSCSLADR